MTLLTVGMFVLRIGGFGLATMQRGPPRRRDAGVNAA
jgi:hypothetical protein